MKRIKKYLNDTPKLTIALGLLLAAFTLVFAKLNDDFLNLNIDNFQIIYSNAAIVFGSVVILSVLIYAVVDLFFYRIDHDKMSKSLNEKLQIVQSMI